MQPQSNPMTAAMQQLRMNRFMARIVVPLRNLGRFFAGEIGSGIARQERSTRFL
jgi:hypothetical protein